MRHCYLLHYSLPSIKIIMEIADFVPSHKTLSETMPEGIIPVLSALEQQVKSPAGGDAKIPDFAIATAALLHEDGDLHGAVVEAVDYRRRKGDTNPYYFVNVLLRVVQKQLLRHADAYQYPETFVRPDDWYAAMKSLINRNSDDYDDFRIDLMGRDVQSNIRQRMSGYVLAAALFPERFSGSLEVLDVGCSQNQGLKAFELPYQDIEVVGATYKRLVTSPRLLHVLSERVNQLIADRSHAERKVGVDRVRIWNSRGERDKLLQEWVRSCSFRPGELLDRLLVAHYDLIDQNETATGTEFAVADFTQPKLDLSSAGVFERSFGLVGTSAVKYHLTPKQRAAMFRNELRYVRPDGLIVVQDFASIRKNHPGELSYPKDIYSKSYQMGMFVYDPLVPHFGFREYWRWQTGRCTRIWLGELAMERLAEST